MATTHVPSVSPVARSSADEIAQRNWAENLRALHEAQPGALNVTAGEVPDLEWLFARDGSATAMLQGQRWWAGCSVPRAAARVMLRKMDIAGNVACFLSPIHAAQLRVALDMLERRQAIIALVPDPSTLYVILHCEDFSRDIAAHRLWFAAGKEWERELAQLFVDNPGLPTPAQFIRPIVADPQATDRLIAPAQKVFADENTRRADQIRRLASLPRAGLPRRRVCVVAPSQFRLWDPAPHTLANMFLHGDGNKTITARFDPDDPASASPLALGSAIAECDAIVSANFTRADAPDVAPMDVPWISWVTTPRIPLGASAGPKDVVLLADPAWRARALGEGWTADRVHIAAWPEVARGAAPHERSLALIADTQLLQPPKSVEDYSSHKLLWEMIADELLHDPFAIGDDVHGYLGRKSARLQIGDAGFDRTVFIERLIVPAWQQGLARLLVREALPVRIRGKGWERIEVLAPHAGGAVHSSLEFDSIVDGATALVHAWPSSGAHPINAVGRPVVRAFDCRRNSFLRDARLALKNGLPPAAPASQHTLSWKLIAPLID